MFQTAKKTEKKKQKIKKKLATNRMERKERTEKSAFVLLDNFYSPLITDWSLSETNEKRKKKKKKQTVTVCFKIKQSSYWWEHFIFVGRRFRLISKCLKFKISMADFTIEFSKLLSTGTCSSFFFRVCALFHNHWQRALLKENFPA